MAVSSMQPTVSFSTLVEKNVGEGMFWSVWFGHVYSEWKNAIFEYRSSAVDQAKSIWHRSKKLVEKTCDLVAGGAGVFAWAVRVCYAPLGCVSLYLSAIGCWSGALAQSIRLNATVTHFRTHLIDYFDPQGTKFQGGGAFRVGKSLSKICLEVSLVAWSLLGGAFFLFNLPKIQSVSRLFLYCAAGFSCIHFAMIALEPKLTDQTPSS